MPQVNAAQCNSANNPGADRIWGEGRSHPEPQLHLHQKSTCWKLLVTMRSRFPFSFLGSTSMEDGSSLRELVRARAHARTHTHKKQRSRQREPKGKTDWTPFQEADSCRWAKNSNRMAVHYRSSGARESLKAGPWETLPQSIYRLLISDPSCPARKAGIE